MALVLKLGMFEFTQEPEAPGLLVIADDGTVDVVMERTFALAAQRIGRDVECEPALAMVGRGLGWRSRAPTAEENFTRATLALGVFNRWPPAWMETIERFVSVWCEFWPLKLWEQMPANMGLPGRRRTGARVTRHLTAVMGQGGQEFGVALYDDRDDFDRAWGGLKMEGVSRAVLSGDDDLSDAFDPLSVPCPMLVTSKAGKPRAPQLEDLLLATGTMEVLVGVIKRSPSTVLGRDDVLELERDSAPPENRASKPKKR